MSRFPVRPLLSSVDGSSGVLGAEGTHAKSQAEGDQGCAGGYRKICAFDTTGAWWAPTCKSFSFPSAVSGDRESCPDHGRQMHPVFFDLSPFLAQVLHPLTIGESFRARRGAW